MANLSERNAPAFKAPARKKSHKIRNAARGRDCEIRIPGVCNGNPETVVLAHYRLAGTCGIALKPDDSLGAFGCRACHDEVDRRTHHIDSDTARLYHAEGVMRTQLILKKENAK